MGKKRGAIIGSIIAIICIVTLVTGATASNKTVNNSTVYVDKIEDISSEGPSEDTEENIRYRVNPVEETDGVYQFSSWEFDEDGNIVGPEVMNQYGEITRLTAVYAPAEYMEYFYECIYDRDICMSMDLPGALQERVDSTHDYDFYICYWAAVNYFGDGIVVEEDREDKFGTTYDGFHNYLFLIDGVPYKFYYNDEVVRIAVYEE